MFKLSIIIIIKYTEKITDTWLIMKLLVIVFMINIFREKPQVLKKVKINGLTEDELIKIVYSYPGGFASELIRLYLNRLT